MEQIRFVTEAAGGFAKVRVDRESSCGGNCVSCKGCPSEAIVVSVKNELGLRKGDTVVLYEDTRKVIKYALIGYGLLALLMVVGAVVGYVLTHRDFVALLSAAAAVAIGFLCIKLAFKNVDSDFKVTEIKNRNYFEENDNE